jgi:hypothetical protein
MRMPESLPLLVLSQRQRQQQQLLVEIKQQF